MQATTDDLTNLLRMQQIDLDLMKAKKKLEELPQRATILAARQKKRTIEQKRDQVAEMRARAEGMAAKLEAEDAELAEKQRRVQEAIDGSLGNYRNVEAHTKELNGFAKRRNALEVELTRLGEELAKIEGVQSQVSQALAEVDKQEAAAIVSFQREGGALQAEIARMSADREGMSAELSPELRDTYNRTASRTGGVAVGLLTEGRCGVCRTVIDGGRLIDLKAEAPLGTCPHCKRLLVVM
ncbi:MULTISPECIES: zinc ribbon domain-containing protein [Gordonibacter]|jgi:predicted  nucleic acid-binding Zn-ribbon protein|uniref:CT398-like coiled coil hairpin domain-containing protein n=1 Tax=Gordonibacter urolithinfaciens TaxID=1335613 RepID=A0A6N8IN77_9ACTN|nr:MULTISPECIES: hypothetical protein [Gordonibacter]MBS6976363.1 hypothetical protein [Eggerthellaceae bacterium]MCB6562433.1 hypothetical protein [Gordonibacter urolithinfaciens]MCB7086672.1 hypothetical protein [Gordonibacter urolithinfaciens]MSA96084.1 hypothetical protein [Gordonibacter urolithinfaciens]MVM55974.1 hypothetical protein [Gordonibacter urolithinfaciens]